MFNCLIHVFWLNMSFFVIDFLMFDEEVWAWSYCPSTLNAEFVAILCHKIICCWFFMNLLYWLFLLLYLWFKDLPYYSFKNIFLWPISCCWLVMNIAFPLLFSLLSNVQIIHLYLKSDLYFLFSLICQLFPTFKVTFCFLFVLLSAIFPFIAQHWAM